MPSSDGLESGAAGPVSGTAALYSEQHHTDCKATTSLQEQLIIGRFHIDFLIRSLGSHTASVLRSAISAEL